MSRAIENRKKSKRPAKNTERRRKKSGIDFEIALSDIVSLLKRRIWLVLGCSLVSLGLATLYMILSTVWYESKAQILVEQRDPAAATEGMMVPGRDAVSDNAMATHLKLVQSRRIVSTALERSGLGQLQSIIDALDAEESPIDYVLANLSVSSGGEGNARSARVLNLSFQHTVAEEAKSVLDAIIKEYQLFLEDKYKNSNSEAARLIDDARGQIKKDLDRTEEEYRKFRETAPIVATSESGSNVYEQRYEEIQAEISDVDSKITESQARLILVEDGLKRYEEQKVPDLQKLTLIDQINAERLAILMAVERGEVDTAEFQSKQPERMAQATSEFNAVLEKKARLNSMEQNLGKSHPDVVAMRGEIALAESFVKSKAIERGGIASRMPLTPNDVMIAYVTMLRNDLEALKARKMGLITQASETETLVKSLVDYELTGEYLMHERERQQSLFDSAVDHLRMITMSSEGGGFIHEVIEAPESGKAVSPSLLIAGLITVMSLLLLSTISIGYVELSDRSIHKPEELESIFGSQVLSHVPELFRDPQTRKIMAEAKRTDSTIDSTLVSYFAPRSRISEVFRGMRTQVLFTAGSDNGKIIGITSAKSGEGKSTIAGNLAISMAQTGREVLLVDCDLRRPRIHKLFANSNACGLSELLTNKCELSEVIQKGHIPSLSTLTSGTVPDNPAELLDSECFDQLLKILREKFDLVILDCPPVLPVSDPAIIAPKVDGMVVVVRIDGDCRPQSLRVKQILDSVEARMLGLVVNRSTEARGQYTYNSYGYESTTSGREYYHSPIDQPPTADD